jgi:hypothetical protein
MLWIFIVYSFSIEESVDRHPKRKREQLRVRNAR